MISLWYCTVHAQGLYSAGGIDDFSFSLLFNIHLYVHKILLSATKCNTKLASGLYNWHQMKTKPKLFNVQKFSKNQTMTCIYITPWNAANNSPQDTV